MPTLFTYLQQVQRLLGDSKQELVDPGDIIDWTNTARRETAMRSMCIRILPVISGSVVAATNIIPGSGYTAPTLTITPPDMPSGFLPNPMGAQATATAILLNGQVISVNISYGGAGYFQPKLIITDATGTGAGATLVTSLTNTLNQGQEQYPFSSVDLSPFPGVGAIYLVRSVSIIYSNYRYSLPMYSFSTYQSQIRQFVASQYQYVPVFCAQLGQGTNGTLFMYPPPSQTYPLEWDCQCLPQDLTDDQSVEAIADPWTDAVPYFAAHLGFLSLMNFNASRAMLDLFNERMSRFGGYSRPGRVSNMYGRW